MRIGLEQAAARRETLSAASLLAPASVLVCVMMLAPLVLLARYSINRFDPTQMMIAALTPENYVRFFSDPFYLHVMVVTIRVSAIVTVTCLALGIPMSWRLARTQSRWKSAYVMLLILPLFIGSVTRTAGWMILFARGGMLDIIAGVLFGAHGVDLMYTETAVILGIISINLPFTILTLQSVFEGIDPRLEEAAASMGAPPARSFLRVIIPLSMPGIMIGGALCFILSMNAFPTPLLLGGPRFQMMAPLLYWEFNTNNNWPFAGALAFILMGTTLALTLLANVAVPRRYRPA
ncbi:MAG: ABC transporter permease [Rhodospirillales bacterium 70-18]|nr:ABC transporter permease [Rhodospirillales bacterium]OJY67443.1 MAG: ABC transporter permease [Rhodospirillales bacterium 70-18]